MQNTHTSFSTGIQMINKDVKDFETFQIAKKRQVTYNRKFGESAIKVMNKSTLIVEENA